MKALHVKNWFTGSHLMRGSASDEFKGIVHDRHFWEIIITAAIVSLLIMFFAYLVWANVSSGTEEIPFYPGYPFTY